MPRAPPRTSDIKVRLSPTVKQRQSRRLAWRERLPRSLRCVRDHFIGRVELWFRLCYFLADARKYPEHRRLLVGRQADQFAAAVYPSFARLIVDGNCLRIDR